MSKPENNEPTAPAVGLSVERRVSPAGPERDIARDAARLQFLEDETMLGKAPNLVFDDDGNWCVSYPGMQPTPRGDGAVYDETASITCIVEPHEWRPSLREAIDAAMEEAAREDGQG